MTETTKQFKRQLPRNTAFQVISFGTQVLVGICLVPYLVRHLGVAAYGLIPVAAVLTQYASLITQSIASAVNRFLTIALQKDDPGEANRIFSTAFYTYLALGLLQVPVFVLGIRYADSIVSIPDGLYEDAVVLLACSAATFVINLTGGVFGVSMYARNRLDISRSIDIGRHVFRLAGVVCAFSIFGPALRFVGYVDLTIAIALFVAQVVISNRLVPDLELRLRHYDWRKIKELVGMGGWLLINNLGTLLFLRLDVWVCNRFVSPEAAGEYAAVLQWATLMRHGGIVISAVTAPMITIYYAKSEMENVLRMGKLAVRTLSLAMAVPIAILCVFSQTLLTVWLGESFAHLAPLMMLLLCHLVVNIGVLPLFSIQLAMNKVKIPALVTMLMGILNFALAVFFAAYLDWGVYGVAIAGATVLTSKNAIFTPAYAAGILGAPWHVFVKPYLAALGLLGCLTAVGGLLNRFLAPSSLLCQALLAMGMGAAGLAAVWLILPDSNRRLIRGMLPAGLKTPKTKIIEG